VCTELPLMPLPKYGSRDDSSLNNRCRKALPLRREPLIACLGKLRCCLNLLSLEWENGCLNQVKTDDALASLIEARRHAVAAVDASVSQTMIEPV
jgi:hypothetical protein